MQTDFSGPGKKNRSSFSNLMNNDPEPIQMENELFETENENPSLVSFLKKAETDLLESNGERPSIEQDSPFLSSFLVELIHSVKNTLISIKNFSLLPMEKPNDAELRKVARRGMTEDIMKIDSVLNSLLNYIHINTPIVKSNTLFLILEEILEANEKQILSKKIKILKKYEKDLPETSMHDEQVRFILNSLLQYILLSIPLNGAIGFIIKSFDFQEGGPEEKIPPERDGGYIGATIGFTNDQAPNEPPKNISASPTAQKEKTLKLILQLVQEILQKNHGSITYEADPKKRRTYITLKFPIERRKVFYYEPISI